MARRRLALFGSWAPSSSSAALFVTLFACGGSVPTAPVEAPDEPVQARPEQRVPQTAELSGALEPSFGPFVHVAAGHAHTCALGRSGHVWCFGNDYDGQLGDGATPGQVLQRGPLAVLFLTDAVTLSAGRTRTCAVRRGGSVVCWGGGPQGPMTRIDETPLYTVNDSEGTAQVSVGDGHVCLRSSAGELRCFGENGVGQLGAGDLSRHPGLVRPALGAVVDVSAGSEHTCAVVATGGVSCWGRADHGQLGDGVPLGAGRRTPRGGEESVQRGEPYHGPCAASSRDCVDERPVEIPLRSRPGAVVGFEDAVRVSVAGVRSCALRRGGTVSCWGLVGRGRPRPRHVPGTERTRDITVAAQHVCGVRDGGSAYCFGAAGQGRLGDGTSQDRPRPATVTDLTEVVDISAGGSHTAAVLADGTLRYWGNWTQGATEDGWRAWLPAPTAVTPSGVPR